MADDAACSLFLLKLQCPDFRRRTNTHTKRTCNGFSFGMYIFLILKKRRESHSTHVVYPTLAYTFSYIERYSAKKKYTVLQTCGRDSCVTGCKTKTWTNPIHVLHNTRGYNCKKYILSMGGIIYEAERSCNPHHHVTCPSHLPVT